MLPLDESESVDSVGDARPFYTSKQSYDYDSREHTSAGLGSSSVTASRFMLLL